MQKTTGKSKKEVSVVPKRTDTKGSIENERILLESIAGIRKELHITQKELPHLSNNTQQEISRLEQKKHSPSVRTYAGYWIALIMNCYYPKKIRRIQKKEMEKEYEKKNSSHYQPYTDNDHVAGDNCICQGDGYGQENH